MLRLHVTALAIACGIAGLAEAASPRDCLPYDPKKLRIVNEGVNGWLLTDGRSRMLMLDNEADAKQALALAQRHTRHCFIGRNNRRPDRKNYIVEYWEGDSKITTDLGREDCIPYDPNKLRIVNEGRNGWLLTDGRSRMLVLDNQADAKQALALARQHTMQCFIGRNNNRRNRRDYIVQYWAKGSPARETFLVVDVEDGDTITIRIAEKDEKVRLLGVDTAEMRPDGAPPLPKDVEHYGLRRANSGIEILQKEFLEKLVKGKRVALKYAAAAPDRDDIGRILAYVYVGTIDVNAEIARQGYTYDFQEDWRQPGRILEHDRMNEFGSLVKEAQQARRGVWGIQDGQPFDPLHLP